MSENNDSQNSFRKAMDTAVRLLARRAHTKHEIRQKLKHRRFTADVIANVISECERLNYVNDEAAGRFYLRELRAKGYGRRRIRLSMKKKGLNSELTDTLLAEENIDEMEIARKAVSKKMAAFNREKDMRKRKEKIFRFLYSRGFSSSVIWELIRDLMLDV